MPEINIETLNQTPCAQQRFELVERKGIGHPDTMRDAIMEDISLALCREYLAAFGCVLHFNVDKCLLAAGRTEPRLGGGKVITPTRLCGRADFCTARFFVCKWKSYAEPTRLTIPSRHQNHDS